MGAYIVKRLLLMIPTLFGIMLMTFAIIQFVPNAPLSPGAVDFITMDEQVDPSDAEQVFGMQFRSLEAGLREYLP